MESEDGGIPKILPLVPHMEDTEQLDSMIDGYLLPAEAW